MRLLTIPLILLTSILCVFGFVNALNVYDGADRSALNSCSLLSVDTEQYDPLDPSANGMIHNAISLIKFKNPFEPYELMNSLNRNPIEIPVQNIQTKSGCDVTDMMRKYLMFRFTSLTIEKKQDAKITLICNPEFLFDFYLQREMKPLWVSRHGLNTPAEVLVKILGEADYEGLDAATYHRDDILKLLKNVEHKRLAQPPDHEKLAELELLLTDAFFSYGFHLSEGMVEPHSNNFDWHIKKPRKNLLRVFQLVLDNQALDKLVEILQPQHPGYLRLKSALLKYKNLENSGPWQTVPAGLKIRRGDSGKRVAALRSRLTLLGDLKDSKNADEAYFDKYLEEGVRKFQARHGLKVDGVVGSKTLSELNVPVEDRIRQIRLNMERWRWLPQYLGDRYITVNTANFELDLIENGQTVKSSLAIVGKKDRPTPSLSQKITYMELNPYWNIPHKIALDDILPSIKKDPNYLASKHIRIFENWQTDAKEIDPESIDWKRVTRRNFAFKLRQDPKASNALGRVKFMFPNEFSIYLHDTPAHELFNETRRTFSSGCIRIQKPIDLATYLLTNHSEWTPKKLTAAIDSHITKTISLPDPINLHILYWTAWVDKDGMVNFREDIYGRDRQLSMVLDQKINFPEVLKVKTSEEKLLSFRTISETHPAFADMNKIATWLVVNSSTH